MLPILAKKKEQGGIASTIIKNRAPDQPEAPDEDQSYSLEDCARDILAAIKMDDHGLLADALKELVEKINSGETSEQSEDASPHTYEDQAE